MHTAPWPQLFHLQPLQNTTALISLSAPTLPHPPGNKPRAGRHQCPIRTFPAAPVPLPYRGRRVVHPGPSSLHPSAAHIGAPQLLLFPLSDRGSNTTRWCQERPGSYLQDSCRLCTQVRSVVSASSCPGGPDTGQLQDPWAKTDTRLQEVHFRTCGLRPPGQGSSRILSARNTVLYV